MIFIDCEDSFSFNLLAEFEARGLNLEFVSHRVFSSVTSWEKYLKNKLWVFGPGPGHPLDYPHLLKAVEIAQNRGIFCFGLCLGHQILSLKNGFKVDRSQRPLHAQRVKIQIPPWRDIFSENHWGLEFLVQRYNSLGVFPLEGKKLLEKSRYLLSDGEVMVQISEKSFSYQFHPESVGSEGKDELFSPFIRLAAKINTYEHPTEIIWDL